jgi:hypothetical protein
MRSPTLTHAVHLEPVSSQGLFDQKPGRSPSGPEGGTAARHRPKGRPTGCANRPPAQGPLLRGRHVGTSRRGHR